MKRSNKVYLVIILVTLASLLLPTIAMAQEPEKVKCATWYGCKFQVKYTQGTRYGFVGTQIYTDKATPVTGKWTVTQ